MSRGLYAYAIGRATQTPPQHVEAIDGSDTVTALTAGPLAIFVTAVELTEYEQQTIDSRAGDVEWLGRIGYRHQGVMDALMRDGTVIPLRAFTLFRSEASVRALLVEGEARFTRTLERLEGKREWTVQLEIDSEAFDRGVVERDERLSALESELLEAAPGKAFLLRKKMDEERKRAAREAEEQLLERIEQFLVSEFECDAVSESRARRSGAFPQIHLLLNRDEESRLQDAVDRALQEQPEGGLQLAISGPWPPYSFSEEPAAA